MPDIGGVYTISDVVWRDLYGPFLYLEENPNGHAQNFIAYAFRPVTRRTAEQDIAEHFAHHLTTPADRQGVDA